MKVVRYPVPSLMDDSTERDTCYLCDAELPPGGGHCADCAAAIGRVSSVLRCVGVLLILAACAALALLAN